MPIPQISDSELELMKIIWSQGGTALYAAIMDRLAAAGNRWQKNTVITLHSWKPTKSDAATSTPPPSPSSSTRPPRPIPS